MSESQKFIDLGRPRNIWAVGAIHGEAERVFALHEVLGPRFRPGERLVYLGNFLGRGARICETMNELLAFRRALLAMPGMLASDIVYLRGCQEEMWQKLLQLQFAPNPRDVLEWMVGNGVGATLAAYGGSLDQGRMAARDGARALTRWTNGLRAAMRTTPGHETLMSALRRAAYTTGSHGGHDAGAAAAEGKLASLPPDALLFVSSGVDINRPFGAQGDSFWWGGASFHRIEQPYGPFHKIVRGYDPNHTGLREALHTVSVDAGCGFEGNLAAACVAPSGAVVDLITA